MCGVKESRALYQHGGRSTALITTHQRTEQAGLHGTWVPYSTCHTCITASVIKFSIKVCFTSAYPQPPTLSHPTPQWVLVQDEEEDRQNHGWPIIPWPLSVRVRVRALYARTYHHLSSFFPQAIILLNNDPTIPLFYPVAHLHFNCRYHSPIIVL